MDELWARTEAKGYERGAHQKVDEVRRGEKHVAKTKKDQDRSLRRYVLSPSSRRRHCPQYVSVKGNRRSHLVTGKDFLLFYIATSRPQVDEEYPTVDSINSAVEWFFAGFTHLTVTETDKGERSEIYSWVRRTLVLEEIIVNKHRPKHNFTVRDLNRVLLAYGLGTT